MEKATDAFRTISEAAEDLDLPQHVLRFWETKFTQIRPMKRGGGRRYYRPDDIDLLRGIQYLLYGEGYTIKGVQRILREQGVHVVMEVWRHPGAPIQELDMPEAAVEGNPPEEPDPVGIDPDAPAPTAVAPAAIAASEDELPFDLPPRAANDRRHPSQAPRAEIERPSSEPRLDSSSPSPAAPSALPPRVAEIQAEAGETPLPAGILPEGREARSGFKFMDRFRGGSESGSADGLSREDIRRLQATLFELLECKRLLDQTR